VTSTAALTPAWASAVRQHEAAVADFIACLRRVPADAWHRPTAPGKWSPAAVALHVAHAYEFGYDAVTRGAAMRPRVSPLHAWFLRTVVIPVVLVVGRFPGGAESPDEVAPDDGEAAVLSPEQAIARVGSAAALATESAFDVSRGPAAPAIMHAYFGRLPALTAFRFVSTHTRHHLRALDRSVARR
jgi:hypothetical protein